MPTADRTTTGSARRYLPVGMLLVLLGVCAMSKSTAAGSSEPAEDPYCEDIPAASTDGQISGLIIGAEVLLPEGGRAGHGVHIRFNGSGRWRTDSWEISHKGKRALARRRWWQAYTGGT